MSNVQRRIQRTGYRKEGLHRKIEGNKNKVRTRFSLFFNLDFQRITIIDVSVRRNSTFWNIRNTMKNVKKLKSLTRMPRLIY
jgi:hypothetical protein